MAQIEEVGLKVVKHEPHPVGRVMATRCGGAEQRVEERRQVGHVGGEVEEDVGFQERHPLGLGAR